MSQFEQENDFGRGGGEVDDETMDAAWDEAERRLGPLDDDDEAGEDPDLDADS